MIWHIAKREILDNLTRFRFALTLILIMVLMVMNAVVFVSRQYPRRIAEYSEDTNQAVESLKTKSSNLTIVWTILNFLQTNSRKEVILS